VAAPVSFSHLLLSLAHQAMHALGEGTGPSGEADREMASHAIETLRLLQEKTKGNLTADEAKLLGTLLAETEAKYVEKTRT
jgi:hypothetical protein